MEDECEPRSCWVGGHGVVLPLFGDDENSSSRALRNIIYAFLLVWCFMGVGLASDVFMGAIEKITSKRRRVLMRSGGWRTVKVWNDTVSNLTLMAMGSSAPEILLAIIEAIGSDFEAGSLGPSTIVGSAAFNLLIITAVCVSVIPEGETRAIEETQVFCVTALFSILAYAWLVLIVSGGHSKEVVEPWESAVTLALFPALVFVAWLADKGLLGCGGSAPVQADGSAEAAAREFIHLETEVLQRFASCLPDEEIMRLAESEFGAKRSPAMYRHGATIKMISGGRHALEPRTHSRDKLRQGAQARAERDAPAEPRCVVEFASAHYSVLERAGNTADIVVCRRGPWPGHPLRARVATRDGTAAAGRDFVAYSGEVLFEKENDTEARVSVGILQNSTSTEAGLFHVELLDVSRAPPRGQPTGGEPTASQTLAPPASGSPPRTWRPAGASPRAVPVPPAVPPADLVPRADLALGPVRKAEVRILDTDSPGTLKFASDAVEFVEGPADAACTVTVLRVGGSQGEVSCKYRTEDGTACSGVDYVPSSGTLVFKDREDSRGVQVMVRSRGRFEASHSFRVVLEDPEGGAVFCPRADGGERCAICTIRVVSDQRSRDRFNRVKNRLKLLSDASMVSHQKYWRQFIEAFNVRSDADEEDDEEDDEPPSLHEHCMHLLLLPWKLLAALVPPVDYCGGWLCFFGSLVVLGGVTLIVGDLASLLGCCLEIPDSITAITFVALGTSLPDTFASRTAAIQDPTADASVGNVTGSNSVNVFLGLGLPWLMSNMHWDWHKGTDFVVPGGNLVFSVQVFTACAGVCLGVLLLRRLHPAIGAELGGPTMYKYMTSVFLAVLWLAYIALSCWDALANQSPCD